ncbi:MAG TPA: 3TM-type holin [Bacteroidia bacterium]|jgi:hypothetical protein|nr:3TM-type holin [Bacteroidia bacterium]
MSILSNLNPVSAISKAIFGDKGLAGGVMNVLEDTGIVKTPEDKQKAQEALYNYELQMRDKDNDVIKAVNDTMQTEAKSEHWLQWSWRPLVGITFSGVIINNYILLPYFAKAGLQAITIPSEMWNAMLVVLGVAAGTRGWEKIVSAQQEGK